MTVEQTSGSTPVASAGQGLASGVAGTGVPRQRRPLPGPAPVVLSPRASQGSDAASAGSSPIADPSLTGDHLSMASADQGGPSGLPARRRWRRFALVAIAALLVSTVGTAAAWLVARPSAEELYLQSLRDQSLGGQFPSDATAIAHGQSFCRGLLNGNQPQGMTVDRVAVDHLCPEFGQGFHVLQTVEVSGSFTLIDTSRYGSGIVASGGSCSGSGGYSDIGAGTSVVVKSGKGEVLETTQLGSGSGTSRMCSFTFTFEVTEGHEDYVVAVGRRGEQHYSFTTLREDGIDLSMGD